MCARDPDQVLSFLKDLERDRDDDSEGLEDDDLDLINENIGAQSKKVFLIADHSLNVCKREKM